MLPPRVVLTFGTFPCRLASVMSDCEETQNRLDFFLKQVRLSFRCFQMAKCHELPLQVEQQEQQLAKREQQAAAGRLEELREEEQHLHRRVTVSVDQRPKLRPP